MDETWLPVGSQKRPVAVVLGPRGEQPGLRPGGPGLDWGDWFEQLETRGVQGLTTDDAPTLRDPGLDRQPCTVHMQRTVGRRLRRIDDADLTHLDRALLPILQRPARERPPEAEPVPPASGRPWPRAAGAKKPVHNFLFRLVGR